MKAKEWIKTYGLEHYAKYNLRKGRKRGRELDYELIKKYRKKYGADIPLKPPKRYYYAIWDIVYVVFWKATGEEITAIIENCKSPLGRWEDLQANRKEELQRNLRETFMDLIKKKKIPSHAELKNGKIKKIKQIIQRNLTEDLELEEELKKPKLKPKIEPKLEPKPAPEVGKKERIEPSKRELDLRERELELREREIKLQELKLKLQERKLSIAEKFVEEGYSPKEIKELLDTIMK